MLSHGNLLANAQHNLDRHRPPRRRSAGCTSARCSTSPGPPTCSPAPGWAPSRSCFRASTPPPCCGRSSASGSPTPCSSRRCWRCCSTPRAPPSGPLVTAPHPVRRLADLARAAGARAGALPDCDVAQFYGMTEAAPTVTHLAPADHRRRPDRLASMGAPVPGVAGRGRRADGGARPARSASCGSAGRTSCSATGTVRRPPPRRWSTAGTAPGTSAAPTPTGYLCMVDRAKDMIITGGENVYSIEVEAALAEHAAVAEAAVFGVPDERWGEAVHAVGHVRRGADATAEELIEHCRAPDRRLQGAALDRPARPSRCRSRARARCSRTSCASRSGRAATGA